MVTRTRAAAAGLLAAVALTGCQVQPQLVSAQAQKNGDAVLVEVGIPGADAAKIKSREIYTYVRVGDCHRMQDGYPAEAYVDEVAVSRFSFGTNREIVGVSGTVPAHVFEKYQAPCAALEGGGYFTGTLVSAPVPVKMGPVR